MGSLARARVPLRPPAPGEKCEPPTQAGGSADTALARPSPHKVQPGRDSGRQERVTKRRSAQAGDSQLGAQIRAQGPRLGGGDGTDGAVRLGSQGPAGAAARPGAGRRLLHATVEPWKNPGARGRDGPARRHGRGWREQRRPAAGCSHGKTHRCAGAGATGEGRRAPDRPATLAGPPGRGCSRIPPRERSSQAEGETRENRECRAGRGGLGTKNQKYPGSGGGAHPGSASIPSCSQPGREGGRPGARRVHADCTRPLGSCGSGWWPAPRGRAQTPPPPPPGQGADACAAAHTPLYTHDHIHARAP